MMEDKQDAASGTGPGQRYSYAGYNQYRMYEHPLRKAHIVKLGNCWPALFFAPLILLYRRLWLISFIYLVAVTGLPLYLLSTREPGESYDWNIVDEFNSVLVIAATLVVVACSNKWWEESLIRRGFVATKSVEARSHDEALAILERQKQQ
jgi:hypothetical protein